MKLTDLDILTDIIEGTDWYHINKDGELVQGANSATDVPLYKADDIYRALESAPNVDAEKVAHGYWYKHLGFTLCSRCQTMFDVDLTMLQVPSAWKMPNYCPHCGAKMDGGAEDVRQGKAD